MFKSWMTVLVLLGFSLHHACAQNLQLHYNTGKDRGYFNHTLEMFKPDTFGSTFLFVDLDYNMAGNKTMSLGYFEIARYITLPIGNRKLDVTVQFNDGVDYFIGPLGQAWLAGLSYPLRIGNFEIKADVLYRAAQGSEGPDAQLTLAWYHAWMNDRLVFTGYLDAWTQGPSGDKKGAVMAEPQLWYRFWNALSAGSELKTHYHFMPDDKLHAYPSLALKWDF